MSIVLDLDSTLIYTCEEDDSEEIYQKLELFSKNVHLRERIYRFDFQGEKIWGVYRPYVFEFLSWAHENFQHVIFWSAGLPEYVKKIVRLLYHHLQRPLPQLVFTREHCIIDEKKETVKQLSHIFQLPIARELGITKKDTVLIDDNKHNYRHNKKNTFLIKAYRPKFTLEELMADDDRALLDIQEQF